MLANASCGIRKVRVKNLIVLNPNAIERLKIDGEKIKDVTDFAACRVVAREKKGLHLIESGLLERLVNTFDGFRICVLSRVGRQARLITGLLRLTLS